MSDFSIVQGTTQPVLTDTLLQDDGTPPPVDPNCSLTLLLQPIDPSVPSWSVSANIDDDQAVDVSYQFTTSDTANPGDIQGKWLLILADGSTMAFPTIGFINIEVTPQLGTGNVNQRPPAYQPSPQEVASILMARTRDPFGNLLGDFTSESAVSAAQASAAIQMAVDEIAEAIGTTVPNDMIRGAKRWCLFLSAANIEMSYYPEQANQANSMYDKLMARAMSLQTRLMEDVAEEEIEETLVDQGGYGGFPPPYNWERRPW